MARKQATRSSVAFFEDFSLGRRSLWLVGFCALALYANTLWNGTALDDGLVLRDNAYVLKGLRGIPDILLHDSFHGAIGESVYLSGGRYRPLPLVTFAVEVALVGLKPAVHHLVNVLLFALTALVLLTFLRRHVFREHSLAALACALLFVFHPIHTEVVAGIKGRDEILSLLFVLLTLHYLLISAGPDGGRRSLSKAAICYALALLSKENGVILVLIAPLTLYIFAGTAPIKTIRRSIPLVVIAAGYIALRFVLLGRQHHAVTEVMDNPYLLATGTEKIATILFVFLKYMGLLFFPYPLTYDYSYDQIPYRTFGDPLVLASLALLCVMLIAIVRGTGRRDVLAWCAIFFLGTWLLVSNAFYNIGAPMAERFMYQGSVPFLIAVVELVRRSLATKGMSTERARTIAAAVMIPLLVVSSIEVIERNTDWRSDDTLLLHDITVSDHSARAQTYAGIALLRRSDTAHGKNEIRQLCLDAIAHFDRADSIKRDYVPTLLNKGVACFRLDSIDRAEALWDRARMLDPNNDMIKGFDQYLVDLHYKRGMQAGAHKDVSEAVMELKKAVRYGPTNVDAWYNLGGAYFTAGDTAEARTCWERTLMLAPEHSEARQGMAAIAAGAH